MGQQGIPLNIGMNNTEMDNNLNSRMGGAIRQQQHDKVIYQ